MMLDMIERVGIGGDFLKEKETARRLRAGEHFTPVMSPPGVRPVGHGRTRRGGEGKGTHGDALRRPRRRDRPLADDRLAELAAVCGVTREMALELGH